MTPAAFNRPLDWWAWRRLGRPPRGEVLRHPRLSYSFERGAEAVARLTSAFGDPLELSVADLGAGQAETHVGAQIIAAPWRRLVCVEAFPPYVQKLRAKSTGAAEIEIRAERIENFIRDLTPGEIDVALLIDVLEHFPRAAALNLLVAVRRKFRLGAAIFIPLGKVAQEPYDDNELQRHRSTWRAEEWARLGFDVEHYEGLHGQLTPPADAGWAIARWG